MRKLDTISIIIFAVGIFLATCFHSGVQAGDQYPEDKLTCQSLRMQPATDYNMDRWAYLCRDSGVDVCRSWYEIITHVDELAEWLEMCTLEATEAGCEVKARVRECSGAVVVADGVRE